MAEPAVVEAVENRLIENFSAATIKGLTGGDIPQDGSAFVTLQFPLSDNQQMVLGRKYQESGAFRIIISTERGLEENLKKGLFWAKQISDVYRTQRFGGVKSWTPSIGRLDDDNDDGNYYVLSVVVPYTFTYNG